MMKDCSVKKRVALACMFLMLYAAPVEVYAQKILTEGETEAKAFTDFSKSDIVYEQSISWKMVCNTSVFYFSKDTTELNYYLQLSPFKFSVAGISTFVHESLHHFDYVYAMHDAANLHFYLDSSTVLQVPKYSGKIIPNGMLKRFTDQVLPDDFDRVHILNDKASRGSRGIYTLLAELSAYSQNRIFLNEIYPVLDTLEYVNNEAFWKNMQLEHENQMLAYYKFNLYIAHYLQVAKASDTAFYNHLMSNLPLRTAYTAVAHRFKEELARSSDLFSKPAKNGHASVLHDPVYSKDVIQQARINYNRDDIRQILKEFAYLPER